jgi:hypothetical protein
MKTEEKCTCPGCGSNNVRTLTWGYIGLDGITSLGCFDCDYWEAPTFDGYAPSKCEVQLLIDYVLFIKRFEDAFPHLEVGYKKNGCEYLIVKIAEFNLKHKKV